VPCAPRHRRHPSTAEKGRLKETKEGKGGVLMQSKAEARVCELGPAKGRKKEKRDSWGKFTVKRNVKISSMRSGMI